MPSGAIIIRLRGRRRYLAYRQRRPRAGAGRRPARRGGLGGATAARRARPPRVSRDPPSDRPGRGHAYRPVPARRGRARRTILPRLTFRARAPRAWWRRCRRPGAARRRSPDYWRVSTIRPAVGPGRRGSHYRRHQPPSVTSSIPASRGQQAFIKAVAEGAMATQRKYGVPAAVTIAQAIDESGWGQSFLATRDHNLFGIKGSGPAGSDMQPTQEVINGQAVSQIASFRVYHSMAQSIEDHGRLLASGGPYQRSMTLVHDPNAFASSLTGVYATDPSYGAKLISLMHRYNLYRYDHAASAAAPRAAKATRTQRSSAPRTSAPSADIPGAPAPAATSPRSRAARTPAPASPSPTSSSPGTLSPASPTPTSPTPTPRPPPPPTSPARRSPAPTSPARKSPAPTTPAPSGTSPTGPAPAPTRTRVARARGSTHQGTRKAGRAAADAPDGGHPRSGAASRAANFRRPGISRAGTAPAKARAHDSTRTDRRPARARQLKPGPPGGCQVWPGTTRGPSRGTPRFWWPTGTRRTSHRR